MLQGYDSSPATHYERSSISCEYNVAVLWPSWNMNTWMPEISSLNPSEEKVVCIMESKMDVADECISE